MRQRATSKLKWRLARGRDIVAGAEAITTPSGLGTPHRSFRPSSAKSRWSVRTYPLPLKRLIILASFSHRVTGLLHEHGSSATASKVAILKGGH